LINIAYVYAIPPDEMRDIISVGGLAMRKLFGVTAERLVSVLIAFALLSSLSAFIIIGPRVYYAMARDGLFFKSISRVHPKVRVPVIAIALQGGISIIIVISGSLDQILTYMGFSLGIFPLLAVAGTIKLRLSGKTKLKIPGFPIAQVIYLISGLMILILTFLERPLESLIAIFTVVVGIPIYYLFRKFRK
jgi:APA family basic amino acid/polyamine antiporter